MKILFSGVCTALVTPFKNGEVDYDALGKLIQRQIAAGIDALCVNGSTGEASLLTEEERVAIAEFTNKQVRGRVSIIGVDALMLTVPPFARCTQEGAVKYFHATANELKKPIIIYNVPSRTGVNLEPETLARICKNKYICGVKEASGNIEQIANVVRLCKKPVYCGDDTIALPCYSIGCKGIISVASNIRPIEVKEIWLKRSARLFLRELPFYKSLFTQVNPIPVKHELAKMGLIKNELRLPLTPMK